MYRKSSSMQDEVSRIRALGIVAADTLAILLTLLALKGDNNDGCPDTMRVTVVHTSSWQS